MLTNKTKMPTLDSKYRIRCFDEVNIGYATDDALKEASRCLNCKNKPCVSGCPVNIDIPSFIKKINENDFEGAYDVISLSSSLASICGRVCPQESQCEKNCTLGIRFEPVGIGYLERFVADYHNKNGKEKNKTITKNGKKVAIVGSGPSGLACAYDLALYGYDVDIYEALHIPGGVLVYGIPEFRLPKKLVEKEIEKLENIGVNIYTNTIIGKTITMDYLRDKYDAIFIGSGAGLPNFMNIEGEDLNGVYAANEYLTRINLMKAYDDEYETPIIKGDIVAVIGGGNVAMDACRSALRLGASKVYIIYRRSEVELPARKEEVMHAKEEGIEFMLLTNPIKIHGDEKGNVTSIECVKMELGEPDEKGRRRPIVIENSNFIIQVDTIIMAIGTSPNPLIKETTPGLEVNRHGCLIVDENEMTSIDNIYAGGDAVTGAATVISAMGQGKNAAKHIDEKLRSE